MKRRDFLKGVAGGAVLTAVSSPIDASAEKKPRLDNALGILYDATLCIGCQVCMVACKKANDMPYVPGDTLETWEKPSELSSNTLNIIKKYEGGESQEKDVEDGFSFVKRHCMHCVDPACVSVCPVSALSKDPDTGVVTYNEKACIGCRYCQVACPFNIPKFQWESAFPKIVKCQLCSHLFKKNEISACCSQCPTGASLFGPVNDLMAEAKRRLQLQAGGYADFPLSDIRTGKTVNARVAAYNKEIYGESEVGGTQVIMLSGVSFTKLGLPELPDESYTGVAETIQHTLYKGLILPAVAFAGLAYVIKKNTKE
nr:hydrogenase 2 operon protein HybA [Desulfobulbaceae bacterium]